MKYSTVGEDQDIFTIEVRLTSKCNYNCYYCTDLHYNKVPFVVHNVKHICDAINAAYTVFKKPIYLYIYGGEPTIYPHLNEYLDGLIEYVNCDVDITIDIQSNLSLKVDWWKNFCEKYQKINHYFKICGSYHNTQTTIHGFLNRALLLKKYNMLNKITFMYNKHKCVMDDFNTAIKLLGLEHCEISPLIDSRVSQPKDSNIDELEYINNKENINSLKSHSFFFNECIPVQQKNGSLLKKSRFDFWINNDNVFTGCKCYTPLDRLVIDWDGSAFYCESHLFSESNPIFNINNKNDYLTYFKDVKPTTCAFKKCFFNIESKKIDNDVKHINISNMDKYNSIYRYETSKSNKKFTST
jgi:organic radical activating enzyme